MKTITRIIGSLIFWLLATGSAISQAPTYLNSLAAATSANPTDTIAVCQNAGGCGSGVALKGLSLNLLSLAQGIAQANCANTTSDPTMVSGTVSLGLPTHIIGTCDYQSTSTGISLATQGQHVYGDGVGQTIFNVGTNASIATGLFQCATGAPPSYNTGPGQDYRGPSVSDLEVVYQQVNTATRASLHNFAPTFYFQNCWNFRLLRIRDTEPMVAIDMRGQSGESVIEDFQASPISAGVWGTGSTDLVVIRNVEFYPYGNELMGGSTNPNGCSVITTPTNLCLLYETANVSGAPETTSGSDGPIGFNFGHMDLIEMSDDLCFIGQCMNLYGASDSNSPGIFTYLSGTNLGFDTGGGINMSAGVVRLSSSYFGTQGSGYFPSTNQYGLNQTLSGPSGVVSEFNCASCDLFLGSGAVTEVVAVAGTVVFTGANFHGGNTSTAMLECETAAVCNITGSISAMTSCPAAGCFLIDNSSSGARGNISGLISTTAGGGSTLINYGVDTNGSVVYNSLNGWKCTAPASQTNLKTIGNGGSGNVGCN